MDEKPSSKTPVRRYENSPDMYSDAKIRQALDDGVKWEQIAMQMFEVEKVENTKNRRIREYISTASSTDRRRRPCGTCPVEDGTATEPLHNIMVSAQHRKCLTCLQITHALILAPSHRNLSTSEDPVEDRMQYLYERGYFMVRIKSANGALFLDPCVNLMWLCSRGYELVEFDGDEEEDDEDTPESRDLANALSHSWIRIAIDEAGEDCLPMAVRSRTTMLDDFAGSVRWAKARFDVCAKDHDCCVPPAEQLLPTRVLALETNEEGEETVRLVASGGIRDHYACLSHCWGESPVLRTLRSNIYEHEKGIDHDSLGTTFQDAVQFCRALGIKYCWIDALCIVQDDDQDWAHESASMCNIYSNAYIALSATAALDGTRGFRKHANPEYHGVRVPSQPRTRVLCRPILDHELFQDRQGDAWGDYSHFIELPLLQRGWVYQERVLSPRVLHFGQELVWECNTTTVCECSGTAITDKPWKALRSFPAAAPSHADGTVAVPRASEDKSNPWGDHITQYTSLALTKPSDIFPAIGGVARRYARANPDLGRYLAGLWEKTLLRDLYWRPKNNRSEARLGQWRAPSWSWASQAAPVEFLVKDDEHFACEVISAMCDTKNTRDPYGEIDPNGEATLTIRAPIVDVIMEYKLDADLEEENPKLFWDPESAKPGDIVWHDGESKLVVADGHVQGSQSLDSDEDSLHGSQDEDADGSDSLQQIAARRKDDRATIPLSTVTADTEKKHLGVCAGMSSFDIQPDAKLARDVPSGSTVQLLMLTHMERTAWDVGLLLAPSPTHPGKHMRIGTFEAMYGWSWRIPVDLWSVREIRTVAIV